ncbi:MULTISPECIES: M3 family metallopeptidase [Methylobacterium]|uniref:Dipeptidyl carboxypeptidase n=1 Tax=Methylobacterium thuringiense TaxID=1003091 RepID=A0ABQ4TFB9_9HYPH|nr:MULTISPECIES: M3 family metallopeptidase [Methylobacterium]TXN23817.1 M3 family metallopeptidase [Methylobacterium sp. WL9]GJE54104.1 Dipeptidyl carboxypeptidase [Methylobacterium thuringiense]
MTIETPHAPALKAAHGAAGANPFDEAVWSTPHGLPPFERIVPTHFGPAFTKALAEHRHEIAAIAGDGRLPTFENTVAAMERAGQNLDRVASTFFNLTGSNTNPDLQAIEREIGPKLARHGSAIYLDSALWARISQVDADAENLGTEERRVLDRYRTRFRRAGADLGQEAKERVAEIASRMAELGTRFSQNLLADESSFTMPLEGEDDLAGLPPFLREAAAEAAEERGGKHGHVITLSRSLIEPFLVFSTRRDLRERAYEAWTRRGEGGGDTDNRTIIAEIVALRAERARLLGYDSFAHFKLDDTMAGSPEAAMDLLREVWAPARQRAGKERDQLQALVQAEGGNFALQAHDWRHYAEKLRRAEHDLDESEIKPYLSLEGVIQASFDTASRLFGLRFEEVGDVPRYHSDVRAWAVTNADGSPVGLFLGDYFARSSKRSGAWMSAFRSQERLVGDIKPIIVNVMNFAKAPRGEPTLLSFDDARTLFHEFGHALHGLLSDVTYPLLSGTAVSGDFVELPSQLYEHWLEQPEVLRRHARHYRTGEPMPEELLNRLLAARTFNQGFATIEYAASAIIDMTLHLSSAGESGLDVIAFEANALRRIAMPAEISMRHRAPHFAHIFSGDGYAAGYYSYIWSEVLDADAFDAFREAGDIFDPETAARLRRFVYGAGNLRDPREAYTAFRGRLPSTGPLLKKRGLAQDAA